MKFEARDPNFEERTRDSFLKQGFMRALGVKLETVEPGRCTLRLQFNDTLSQQHGFFHGGVIATLADVSGGYAAYSLLSPGQTNVTVEFKVNLLSPGVGEFLVTDAAVIKAGRTLTICRGDVYAESSKQGKVLCATSISTYMGLDS